MVVVTAGNDGSCIISVRSNKSAIGKGGSSLSGFSWGGRGFGGGGTYTPVKKSKTTGSFINKRKYNNTRIFVVFQGLIFS